MTKTRKIGLRLAAIAMACVGLLAPVTLSTGGGVPIPALNDACASESCCFELGSVCERDGMSVTHYRAGKTCSDT